VREFAEDYLRPNAARLDVSFEVLSAAWERFTQLGLHLFTDATMFSAFKILAAESGAFAFLALQQWVAGLRDGQIAGVAYGHLRDPNSQTPIWRDGVVSGTVPWFTGAGIFPKTLLGFRLEDGSEVRAWVDATDREAFRHGPPMPLIAISSTRTVCIECAALPIAESEFVSVNPKNTQAKNDAAGVIWQLPLLIGNCYGSLQQIKTAERGNAALAERQLTQLDAKIQAAFSEKRTTELGPELRARAGDLAVRLARLACMTCGGASLITGHPAERLYREAIVFNLMAQTDQIVADAFGVFE
jgi:hypothetical protein